MEIKSLVLDKELKAKVKTEMISQMVLDKTVTMDELILVANQSKDSGKAMIIEAIEFATKKKPEIATEACLGFVVKTLTEKAPRIKWESAKVIGNIAHLYPDKLDEAIRNLLVNSEFPGTVVRWSAAFALGEIIKLKTSHNQELIPAIESICLREENNGTKKIYMAALKKVTV